MPVSGVARSGLPGFPAPYWAAPGAALYLGDVRACLRAVPTRSVHTVVTSPPYWGLRDYETGTWGGGSAECDHAYKKSDLGTSRLEGAKDTQGHRMDYYKQRCGKCGAERIDMQIGAEPSPDCGTHGQAQCGGCFVCSLVGVFRDVYRVLRDDGTVWLNLGDTYGGGSGGQYDFSHSTLKMDGRSEEGRLRTLNENAKELNRAQPSHRTNTRLSPGNLVGVPWRVALALQADGWVLRQDIIWYSPNKMPEPVTNRCTKSHEHIFLLAKGSDYYYDAVAIEEPSVKAGVTPGGRKYAVAGTDDNRYIGATAATLNEAPVQENKNKRDVWVVPTTGYSGAHFAVYSPRLITPCILAGTSEYGACAECGRPWERVVARVGGEPAAPDEEGRDRSIPSNRNGITGSLDGVHAVRETAGWRKACGCRTDEVVPTVVLDPFVGSGTTVATALQLGRAGVGIDLSEAYLRGNAVPRIEAAVRGEKVARKPTVAVPTDAPPAPRRLRG